MPRRSERPIFDMIRDLKSGTLTGKSLTRELRRQCVETLVLEGLSLAEIASVIGMSVGTVKNDLRAIRAANALRPSADLHAEVLGQYQSHVEAVIARLSRLTRDQDASVADKINANGMITTISGAFVDRLARVGVEVAPESEPVNTQSLIELVQIVGTISADPNADPAVMSEVRALVARVTSTIDGRSDERNAE